MHECRSLDMGHDSGRRSRTLERGRASRSRRRCRHVAVLCPGHDGYDPSLHVYVVAERSTHSNRDGTPVPFGNRRATRSLLRAPIVGLRGRRYFAGLPNCARLRRGAYCPGGRYALGRKRLSWWQRGHRPGLRAGPRALRGRGCQPRDSRDRR